MDAVTYPDPDVQTALEQNFAALRIDLVARHPDAREAALGQKVMWAPTFVFADARHRELRRFTGWLPPRDFLAELEFVRAFADYQQGRFAEAWQGLGALVERFPGAPAVPEALYWAGSAGYLASGRDWQPLKEAWGRLVREHPGSRFAVHAAVVEDAP